MDVKISGTTNNIPTPGYQAVKLPSSGASAPVKTYGDTAVTQVENQNPEFNKQENDQVRFEAVKEAAPKAIFNYPLGDRKFTIFKDSSGQYVTRYTSLRDGSVTQVPEPELLANISGGRSGVLVETKA